MTTDMKKIDPKEVQRLRAETNAGVMDCKRALEDADGDYEKAKGLLKERGLAAVAKKSGREAKEGVVASYIHAGGRKGALVEVASETDFVARSAEFQRLAQEVAMQVAAMSPKTVDELLAQAYIRDSSKTIKDLVTTLAASVGENVSVRRIQRFAIGEAEGEADA
jgi:elongation factor Ts